MKLSQGVEWMLHGVGVIAHAPPGTSVARRVLAEQYDLPEAYLAKHLKALVRAGILTATTGPAGGFRLARDPADITALEIVEAIEGSASPFVCQEIRQRGLVAVPPELCRRPCGISTVMDRAHQAWRESLRDVTVVDLMRLIPKSLRDKLVARLAANAR
ncbi:Rrf2 family transcriptional regulator [Kribbella capetownensis]|uniref:Rrf2 family transcriptional regulator n=1 Tax=Kribbella capetownensis TaxID=1572659 RepID=A0A4R0JTU0_9ACTN|nr:Rrf2 family transcriptional regulator [Kribbella capetownensis]TCC50851.1 Rrf2 family transcriptional regulator [Kribbella capetownensis]